MSDIACVSFSASRVAPSYDNHGSSRDYFVYRSASLNTLCFDMPSHLS